MKPEYRKIFKNYKLQQISLKRISDSLNTKLNLKLNKDVDLIIDNEKLNNSINNQKHTATVSGSSLNYNSTIVFTDENERFNYFNNHKIIDLYNNPVFNIPSTCEPITAPKPNYLINSSSTAVLYTYSNVQLLDVIINEDSIEHIYKGFDNLKQTYEIWKNVYKAVDGKIVKQKTVYGTFIPPQKESYKF